MEEGAGERSYLLPSLTKKRARFMATVGSISAVTLAVNVAAIAGSAAVRNFGIACFNAYENAGLASPLITKSTTSPIAYTLGELFAQCFARERGGGQASKHRSRVLRDECT